MVLRLAFFTLLLAAAVDWFSSNAQGKASTSWKWWRARSDRRARAWIMLRWFLGRNFSICTPPASKHKWGVIAYLVSGFCLRRGVWNYVSPNGGLFCVRFVCVTASDWQWFCRKFANFRVLLSLLQLIWYWCTQWSFVIYNCVMENIIFV